MGEIVQGFFNNAAAAAVYAAAEDANKGSWGGAASAGGGVVGYMIDRDRIPGLIEDLNKALDKVQQAGRDAMNYRIITPPGGDPYSAHAVQVMGPDLVDNHTKANQAYQQAIKNMIVSLKKAHGGYNLAEDEATDAMNRQKGNL